MSQMAIDLAFSPERERLSMLWHLRIAIPAIGLHGEKGDAHTCAWYLRRVNTHPFGKEAEFGGLARDTFEQLLAGDIPLADIDRLLVQLTRFVEKLERLGPMWDGDPPGPDDVYDARSPASCFKPVLAGALSASWCEDLRGAGVAAFASEAARVAVQQELFQHLQSRLPAKLGYFSLDSLHETLRLEVLRSGSVGAQRQDDWIRVDESRATLLSLLVFLNEDFEGGELLLYKNDQPQVVKPRQGDVIFWEHCLPYESRRVEQGARHVLRADVVYRCPGRVGALGNAAIVAATGELEERPYYPMMLADNPKRLQALADARSRLMAL